MFCPEFLTKSTTKTDQAVKSGRESGFSLVELSIALIVVGALVAVVFKGKDIIDNVRINQTVKHLHLFEQGIINFLNDYGKEPGALPNPEQYIPNCTSSCTWLQQLRNLGLVPEKYTGSYIADDQYFKIGRAGRYDDANAYATVITKQMVPISVLAALDKKMDDGRPNTGRIRSVDRTCEMNGICATSGYVCNVTGENKYEMLVDNKFCNLAFFMKY